MTWFSSRQAATSINHYSRKDTNHHIKGSDSAANRRTLVIVPIAVDIDDRLGSGRLDRFTTLVDTEMDLNTTANWDTVTPTDYTVAATRAGKDFYIYACMQAGSTPKLLLSAASTYPSGYTANNSRKIGGFHGMPGACVNLSVGHPYKDFEAGSILFNSIWDLKDRPRCSDPSGMAKISLTPSDSRPALWVDIYLMNGTGTTPTSVFGTTIKDTVSWWSFVDFAGLVGKRLLRDSEFQLASLGSNEKTAINGGDPVTNQWLPDTAGRSMISNFGCIMMCGALHQYLDEQVYAADLVSNQAFATGWMFCAVTYVASPEGVQVYLKYHGSTPYLCANIASDVWLSFSSYLVKIEADAGAATGTAIYFKYNGTQPARLFATTPTAKTEYIPTNNLLYSLVLTYSASPETGAALLYYDNATHNRLEANCVSNANLDLVYVGALTSYYTEASLDKGTLIRKGDPGDIKMAAGGAWSDSIYCGSHCRNTTFSRFTGGATIGCRFCCDPAGV